MASGPSCWPRPSCGSQEFRDAHPGSGASASLVGPLRDLEPSEAPIPHPVSLVGGPSSPTDRIEVTASVAMGTADHTHWGLNTIGAHSLSVLRARSLASGVDRPCSLQGCGAWLPAASCWLQALPALQWPPPHGASHPTPVTLLVPQTLSVGFEAHPLTLVPSPASCLFKSNVWLRLLLS